jgi:DNA-directed RNA polymerase subunit N (RpoN/RPB10)
VTKGDTGLTRPPLSARVTAQKDEVRLIAHEYFQGLFRVAVYKNVGRPTDDAKKREEALGNVTKYCCRFFFVCHGSKVTWLGFLDNKTASSFFHCVVC